MIFARRRMGCFPVLVNGKIDIFQIPFFLTVVISECHNFKLNHT